MNILVTGAKGFVGRNLCAQLNNIRDGKARWYPFSPAGQGTREKPSIDEVYEYDIDSTTEQLERWCSGCDFVFNLAGVNRPKDAEEFMRGNFGFASTLLDTLRRHGNTCPVMLSSSAQASLAGRFGNSEYGRSKRAGEDLFLRYGAETGARVLVYRFPNLYGKWCRPNYNSAVATFCNNIANGLPITVNDPSVELELLYIDDLVDEMIGALAGREHRCEFEGLTVLPAEKGHYCYCPVTHKATLGEIVDLLHGFARSIHAVAEPAHASSAVTGSIEASSSVAEHTDASSTVTELIKTFSAVTEPVEVPANGPYNAVELPKDSFRYRLMTTFLSYLPKEKAIFDLRTNTDARGSFTELVRTLNCGQVSVNISRPGVTKGEHWHNSKWEQFIVVSGHGLIQLRKEGTGEVLSYEVSGDRIQSVIMLPGYTHNIINLSDTEDLITVMYCNEVFDPLRPDTYSDKVDAGR